MAKILPPEAVPPTTEIDRNHAPKPATGEKGYQKYRSCLRWDFGFTCPFCLQHEADIEPRGAEGTGLTTAEHRELQSDDDEQETRNVYGNCIYACRFCNRDRGVAELVDAQDRGLLDPTEVVWSDHFELRNDQVVAAAGDPDADYTVDSYKPNRPRKVTARRARRKRITRALDKLRRDSVREKKLIEIAGRPSMSAEDAMELVAQAKALRRGREEIVQELADTWPLVPNDAPESCRCKSPPEFVPPTWLVAQAIEVGP